MCEKIKICQVSSVHKTYDTRIYHKMCKSLAKRYEVFYISPNTEDVDIDHIHIKGVELPKSRWKRIFKLKQIYKKMLSLDAEIYHFHDPELIPLGAKIHRKRGKKVIFDSHEDGPMQFLSKEYFPKWLGCLVAKLYTYYEKYYLKQFDAIISVTPSIIERLKKINPQTYQITNYPEYIEKSNYNTFERKVCFFGGILPQWMHSKIIAALKQTNVEYILAGPIYPKDLLDDYLKDDKESCYINYLGVIPHNDCLNIMHQCSAGLAIIDYVPNFGGKLGTLGNNKLFEYMHEGLPVIVTDCILWREIISKYNCGVCVNPHDIDAIRQAILYYVDHPDIAAEHGKNGRMAIKKEYNWENQEKILLDMYSYVLGK